METEHEALHVSFLADYILRKYHNAKGQTQREMIVEELRSEDANIIHRILEFAAKQVITDR